MDAEVRAWRVRERARLRDARMALSAAERAALTEAIGRNLDAALERHACRMLGIYWPIKGELDLRAWAERLGARTGCGLALPVVTTERAPLEYWRWQPGDRMARGFWGIMVPGQRAPVVPDVVIAPLLGFAGLYRLGYGGGYFDRTLASLDPRPMAVGVGVEAARIDGYIPQPHDIPMDLIVTQAGVHRAPAGQGAAHDDR